MILAVLITIGSVGCATRTVYVKPVPLPLPPRPVLTHITAQEMMTIPSKELRVKIIKRDKERKAYAETLENIIKSTDNKKAP